jgi:hypothetical protein
LPDLRGPTPCCWEQRCQPDPCFRCSQPAAPAPPPPCEHL